ncbi:Protein of unknown function [Cotesia congregata]|uniref:Uncharacterized protein n=1 Tax=Cotesia congregata TaxID=51543 RepID=A0A8J2HQI5_COTCN|nr:Protein of unknown function [Cotesia congregata]
MLSRTSHVTKRFVHVYDRLQIVQSRPPPLRRESSQSTLNSNFRPRVLKKLRNYNEGFDVYVDADGEALGVCCRYRGSGAERYYALELMVINVFFESCLFVKRLYDNRASDCADF